MKRSRYKEEQIEPIPIYEQITKPLAGTLPLSLKICILQLRVHWVRVTKHHRVLRANVSTTSEHFVQAIV